MITLGGTFKRVNHTIKQEDTAFSAGTVRLKMPAAKQPPFPAVGKPSMVRSPNLKPRQET
jgi:hypothetical protein